MSFDSVHAHPKQDGGTPARTAIELAVWFLIPGLIQGYVLYLLLSEKVDLDRATLVPAAWFVVVAPIAHFLVTTHRHRILALVVGLWLAVLCSGLVYWHGLGGHEGVVSQADQIKFVISVVSTIVISAAILPFLRTRMQGQALNHYPSLFKYSWNQVVSTLVAIGFVGAVFAVLSLSTALFKLIGINIEPWLWRGDVVATIIGGAFAVGVGICRTRDSIVNGVRYLLISLLRALLPIFVLVIAAFVIAALVNGLDEFADRLSVTTTMLSSIAVALTLCAAAVGDGTQLTSRWLSILCRVLAFLMAALCFLAIWAMWQRVDQHGLTVVRVLAIILLAISSAYSVGYLIAAMSRKLTGMVQQTNVFMILLCGVVAILIQTPLLSTHSIAVNNQLARFHSGEVSAEKLDLGWLKFKAGYAGTQALEKIKLMPVSQEDPLKARLLKLDTYTSQWEYNQDKDSAEMQSRAERLASAVTIVHLAAKDEEEPLHTKLEAWASSQTDYGFWKSCPQPDVQCVLVEADAFEEWESEYLFIMRQSSSDIVLRWIVLGEHSYRYLGDFRHWELPMASTSAAPEQIDALLASALKGELPLGAIEVPAVKLGDQLINPYGGF